MIITAYRLAKKWLEYVRIKVVLFESYIILFLLVFTTLLVIGYSDKIFESYPICTKDNCDYEVPIYISDQPLRIIWDQQWGEFAAFAHISDIDMQTVYEAGLSGGLYDPMMASGFLAALVAIWLSLPLDRKFRDLVHQLDHDNLVPDVLNAERETEKHRQRWAWSTSFVIALVILFGILNYFESKLADSDELIFLLGSTLLGAVGGHRLGSTAAYGRFSSRFRKHINQVNLLPGHADNMGGWQRLGEFMAFEAVLILVPIIWLSTWLFISVHQTDLFLDCWRVDNNLDWPDEMKLSCDPQIPVAYNRYAGWILPQAVLIIIAIVILYMAFLRPLYDTTKAYRLAKIKLRKDYDMILAEPLKLAVSDLEYAHNLEEKSEAIDKIGKLTRIREEIWSMPPVPLRSVVTGLFSLSALYPLVTFFLALVLDEGDNVASAFSLVINLLKASGL